MRLTSLPVAETAVMPSRAAAAPLIEPGDGRARWEPLWTRSTPDLAQASISPEGDSVAWMDKKGAVRRLDSQTGKPVWQTPSLPGMTRIFAVSGGDVLAYAPFDRLRPTIRVLDRAAGEKKGAVCPLDGAIWSVAVANGGSAAFVGTGKGSIYTLTLRRSAKESFLRPTVWSADGIPESLTSTKDGSLALVRHWGAGGIGAWHPTKPTLLTTASVPAPPVWLKPETEATRGIELAVSDNGRTAIALSQRGSRGQDSRLDVLDATTGNRLWQLDLNASGAKARVTSDGQFVAVTSAHMSDYNTGSVLEHKLSYYARDGRKVFGDRGGLYFSPELVALSADGSRITVQSGPGTIFTLDRRGSFKSKLTLPKNAVTGVAPTIRECIATSDGRFLLLIRGDGQITLYRAVAT